MSYINGQPAEFWIDKHKPHDGLFRTWWGVTNCGCALTAGSGSNTYRNTGGICTSEDCISLVDNGMSLRYEWYYKDGKRADGEAVGYYSNGNRKSSWTWKDDRWNGVCKEYHLHGISMSGSYTNGRRHGRWIYYDTSGNIINVSDWDNDKLIEKIKPHELDGYGGDTMTKINNFPSDNWIDANCPKEGLFRAYWTENLSASLEEGMSTDSGGGKRQLRYEWYYKDGKRADGISRGWYQDGTLKQKQSWKDGVPHGIHEFYGNWNELPEQKQRWKNWKAENKNSQLGCWVDDGILYFQHMYKNGKLDGKCTWYFREPNPRSLDNYLKYFKDGPAVQKIAYFKNNMYDGVTCQYYLSGQISIEGNYKENCEVGKWIWYNRDGSNKKIKNYGKGIKNS